MWRIVKGDCNESLGETGGDSVECILDGDRHDINKNIMSIGKRCGVREETGDKDRTGYLQDSTQLLGIAWRNGVLVPATRSIA